MSERKFWISALATVATAGAVGVAIAQNPTYGGADAAATSQNTGSAQTAPAGAAGMNTGTPSADNANAASAPSEATTTAKADRN